jgi:hypothetical protein
MPTFVILLHINMTSTLIPPPIVKSSADVAGLPIYTNEVGGYLCMQPNFGDMNFIPMSGIVDNIAAVEELKRGVIQSLYVLEGYRAKLKTGDGTEYVLYGPAMIPNLLTYLNGNELAGFIIAKIEWFIIPSPLQSYWKQYECDHNSPPGKCAIQGQQMGINPIENWEQRIIGKPFHIKHASTGMYVTPRSIVEGGAINNGSSLVLTNDKKSPWLMLSEGVLYHKESGMYVIAPDNTSMEGSMKLAFMWNSTSPVRDSNSSFYAYNNWTFANSKLENIVHGATYGLPDGVTVYDGIPLVSYKPSEVGTMTPSEVGDKLTIIIEEVDETTTPVEDDEDEQQQQPKSTKKSNKLKWLAMFTILFIIVVIIITIYVLKRRGYFRVTPYGI